MIQDNTWLSAIFCILAAGRQAYIPDAGERRAAPAVVPAPESWPFQGFRTEGFHTGRTGAYSPSLAHRHLSGTSVSLNPVYCRKPGTGRLFSAVTPSGAARLSPAVSGSIRISFLSAPHTVFRQKYPGRQVFLTFCHLYMSGDSAENRGRHVYILPETAGRKAAGPCRRDCGEKLEAPGFLPVSGFRDTDVPERCP